MAFLTLRHGNWVLAGICGAALSATRLVGAVFGIAYATAFHQIASRTHRSAWPGYLLGLLMCPLGLGLFMIYLHFLVGDAFAFLHIQISLGIAQLEIPLRISLKGFR